VLASLIALAPIIQGFQATYTLLPCRMDALLLGSLCAWVVRYQPGSIKRGWLYGGLALGGIVIASLTYRLSNFKLALYGYTVIAVFYACFLLSAVTARGPIAALTKIRWLRRLGILAYGLYMFHVAIQGFFYDVALGTELLRNSLAPAAVTCVSLAVTLLAAELSWRFFEKRFVDIRHGFTWSA
jgi:peptidoglycan/LPS O-acetylase OafA/YrhL